LDPAQNKIPGQLPSNAQQKAHMSATDDISPTGDAISQDDPDDTELQLLPASEFEPFMIH
jgi:hypothetical protein